MYIFIYSNIYRMVVLFMKAQLMSNYNPRGSQKKYSNGCTQFERCTWSG